MEIIEGLDDCLEKIFKYYELDSISSFQEKAESILQEYLSHISKEIIFQTSLPMNKLRELKDKYIYTSSDC